MMVKPLTVLLSPDRKQEKVSHTMDMKMAPMQIRMTLELKSLAVCSFLTSFFLPMVTQKLKKY